MVYSGFSHATVYYLIAIEDAGLGASLQHYNPLIDDEVKENWNPPSKWKLIAQMPLVLLLQSPEKEFAPWNLD